MTTYTLTEARKRFPELVEKSHELLEEFVISRKGHPAAVLVDYDLFESLKETLHISLNRQLAQKLRKARKEVKRTASKTWSELRQELGA